MIFRLLFSVYIAVSFMFSTGVQAATAQVPVESFFSFSKVDTLRLSPSGEYLAAIVQVGEKKKVAILERKTMEFVSVLDFGGDDNDAGNVRWVNDKRITVEMVKRVGPLDLPARTGFLFAANIDGSKKSQLLPRPARPGKAAESPYGFRIISQLKHDPKRILISLYDSSFASAYELNVYNGSRKRVTKSPVSQSSLGVDHQDQIRLAIGWSKEDFETRYIYYRDSNDSDWKLIDKRSEKDGVFEVIGFSKDNTKPVITIQGGKLTDGVYEYQPQNKELKLIHKLTGDADVDRVIFDNDWEAPNPIGVTREPGYIVNEYFDSTNPASKLYESIEAAFAGRAVVVLNHTKDNSLSLILAYGDKYPAKYYLFDNKKNQLSFLLNSKSEINPKDMAEMKPFSFTARDGLEIRGYLTLPNGQSKDLPLVQYVHGGPYGVKDSWRFDPTVQFLANRGYAVMQVNYRGSGGRGPDFIYDNYRKMGAEMQHDLTDAALWAVKEGIVSQDRICMYGASYGGYAAMMAAVMEPDLYKCVIPYVGVYDIAIQKDKSDTRLSKGGRKFLEEAWDAYNPEFVRERSAIYHLDKLKSAIFLVHGRKDRRVPIKNYDDLSDKLEAMNYPFESMIEDHEGHGFYNRDATYKLNERIIQFLDKHIGK